MALIVEDGTGLSTANAYISRAGFVTYHADRNNAAAAALTGAEIDAAILYATVWMDSRYAWRGDIVEDDQALGLPTEDGVDDQGRDIEGLPTRAANACAELAFLHTQNPVNPILGPMVLEQEVVGAVKRKFSDRVGNEGVRYPMIDMMLKGLYLSSGVHFLVSTGS